MPLQATSGAASYDAFGGGVAAVPKYIEDYFSTFLFTGNASTQTITNGIDLAGKGGLVWTKNRTNAFDNYLYDTARGVNKLLLSNNAIDQQSTANTLTAFNSNGFTLGNNDYGNIINGAAAVSWTWAKAPKFFDVVTYTGTASTRTVSHNLGSEPGCIIIKRTDAVENWQVYHRSLNASGGTAQQSRIVLNSTAAQQSASLGFWDGTAPTSTVFTLGGDTEVNASGGTYVAYLFAHNAGGFGLTGTDNVISCGSYTGAGASTTVTLGYEPQWILIKRTNTTGPWHLQDVMRGATVTNTDNGVLYPNTTQAEQQKGSHVFPTATGFAFTANEADINEAGSTYIYIAIRRGPMKVPTTGTSVFKPLGISPASTTSEVGFPADMSLAKYAISSQDWLNSSRLTNKILYTNSTGAEDSIFGSAGPQPFDTQDGFKLTGISTTDYAFWAFKRAPSFFDEVCYTGTGSDRTVAHNLSVVPEVIIIKSRSGVRNWNYLTNFGASTYTAAILNDTYAPGATPAAYDSLMQAQPTSTQFSVSTSFSANNSGETYVAYLFATCAGVSKVGSYTGNGTTQAIACGFTGGARFVLIKRTDDVGDWFVYDTARGMTVLTDPYLLLNSTAAEVATLGSVITSTGGFTVNASVLAAINTNAASYIFLAIA
jgi:hypothetical protein